MKEGKKLKFSLFFVGIFLITLLLSAYLNNDNRMDHFISSDQEGYYLYLKAYLVNDGFEDLEFRNGATWEVTPANDTIAFTKYTYGVAILEAPFVIAAHVLSPVLGYPRNGTSPPYKWGILIGAAIYLTFGMYLLYHWLTPRFSRRNLVVTIFLLLLATNLLYYSTRGAGMSHVYSFFLFSVFIYSAAQFINDKKWFILSLSISLSLIALIRPTNAIIVLALPFLHASKIDDVKATFIDWLKRWKYLLIFIPVFLIVIAPQLAYWKYATGDLISYSYGEEGFTNWNNPQILKVLFSHQNGLFLYTPLMIFITWGIIRMWQKQMSGRFLNPVILLVATYIFASWWAWWFGGAFGHRCYVEYYSIMALPLAEAVNKIQTFQPRNKWILHTVLGLFVFINIRMTDIYNGLWDGPLWTFQDYLQKLLQVFYIDRLL